MWTGRAWDRRRDVPVWGVGCCGAWASYSFWTTTDHVHLQVPAVCSLKQQLDGPSPIVHDHSDQVHNVGVLAGRRQQARYLLRHLAQGEQMLRGLRDDVVQGKVGQLVEHLSRGAGGRQGTPPDGGLSHRYQATHSCQWGEPLTPSAHMGRLGTRPHTRPQSHQGPALSPQRQLECRPLG
jgi:hypothetical protein